MLTAVTPGDLHSTLRGRKVITVLKMRKLRHERVKEPAQGQAARGWESLESPEPLPCPLQGKPPTVPCIMRWKLVLQEFKGGEILVGWS